MHFFSILFSKLVEPDLLPLLGSNGGSITGGTGAGSLIGGSIGSGLVTILESIVDFFNSGGCEI